MEIHSRVLVHHMFFDVVLPVEPLAIRTLNLLGRLQVVSPLPARLGRSQNPVKAVQVVQVVVLHRPEIALVVD